MMVTSDWERWEESWREVRTTPAQAYAFAQGAPGAKAERQVLP